MHFKGRMDPEGTFTPIDFVPLINIVFLLLIFFILTSSFMLGTGIKINLPKVVTSSALQKDNLEIVVSKDSLIYANDRKVTMQELNVRLKLIRGDDRSILIRADRRSSLSVIFGIWELAKSLGIGHINIATNQ